MEWLKVGAVGCTVVLLAGQLACTAPLVQSQAERPAALGGTHTGALTASVLAGTAWTAFAIDGVAEVLSPKPTLRMSPLHHGIRPLLPMDLAPT